MHQNETPVQLDSMLGAIPLSELTATQTRVFFRYHYPKVRTDEQTHRRTHFFALMKRCTGVTAWKQPPKYHTA